MQNAFILPFDKLQRHLLNAKTSNEIVGLLNQKRPQNT